MSIELERAVSSIRIGNRHRTDLGDIDALAASIARDGLLQPPTITPDGVLVCGRRRLAAIQQLGWRTVNVWVRQGISDRLGHLLAEQDDNLLHKDLTPLEAASLYRELKELLAEDAARRQEASRFSSEHQPGGGEDGGGKFPAPSPAPAGEARQQAAAMIPGAASYRTLDKIEAIQQAADRDDLPDDTRAQVAGALARVEAGAPVHPIFEEVRALLDDPARTRDAELDRLAQEAVARAKNRPRRTKEAAAPAPAGLTVWTARSFVVIWGELVDWWTHYDPAVLAGELTEEQIEMFLTIADGTARFATALTAARDRNTNDDEDDDDRDEGEGGVRHLRAL
ncbi:ParB N-terminal domain-containing protein [Brevibacterium casei]|uniref:ParB N-terminal domain-containing protein n=1 Tax=Brevibacterium casei TaxID=33889 RepID=UPI000E652459|nr:ParB N-terminal domain-containing protein [Brevibacterium casei]MBE4696192.1 ParB N-terminal domain-containing protein [Brevibacterium casei]MBY3579314.1 ParB N-terminal domain-containing protein [Brevibacterium casei]MCT1765475.1 ParB N-terminal domain-containing protein [Brevibacterium casei]